MRSLIQANGASRILGMAVLQPPMAEEGHQPPLAAMAASEAVVALRVVGLQALAARAASEAVVALAVLVQALAAAATYGLSSCLKEQCDAH